jgi:co-chaperonin GroES (HSP10)
MPVELRQDSLNVIDLTEIGVSMQAIEDKIIILVDEYKSGYECKTCSGTGQVSSVINPDIKRTCDNCKGKGQTLVIPDTAKSMPSTGVIVSMGPKTEFMLAKKRNEDVTDIPIQIGTRVVFGVHVGTKIPIKGNIKLTIMREKEPLCIVFGSDIGDKEILDYTQDNI